MSDELIRQGTVFRTPSGKNTKLYPKIDLSTLRKTTATVRRIDKWLWNEASKEAEGNDYLTIVVKSINPNRLSPSDKDDLNDIIFGF